MTKEEFLRDRGIPFRKNYPLSSKSTVRIGGAAEFAVFPRTEKELTDLLDYARAGAFPVKVAGGLSNTLVLDATHPGFTVFTGALSAVVKHGDSVTVGAGAKPSAVALSFARDGFGVLYRLYGIPGTVGGGVYGNAGAFGDSFGEECVGATVYDTGSAKTRPLSCGELGFSYRHSALRENPWILLDATFRIQEMPKEEIFREIGLLKVRRAASQPVGQPSLGSVFKRGDSPAAPAFYIDSLGLRGYRIGGAQVSTKHAGFFVNTGGATAADYLSLMDAVSEKVKNTYDVDLIPEIGIY